MPPKLDGKVLAGRYLVENVIGTGAMGTVFRARHVKIARAFAVKVLHPALVSNTKLRRRFEREAEIAGTLRHPNMVSVIDIGETDDGLAYIVMELAEGRPLSALIEDGPLAAPRAIRIARQLCDALHHAHGAGLVHRDFKPDNVIVGTELGGEERARIVDFGIAMLRDETSGEDRERLTTAGIVLGTPEYMAPEHALGEPVDHRIDLFALGVTCYEMLTGRMPFDGDGVDVARANLMLDTPPMGIRVPFLDIDPLLEMFTRKLMKRSRDERFQTAAEARDMLDLIASDREAAAAALGIELGDVSPEGRRRRIPPTIDPMVSSSERPAPNAPIDETDVVHRAPRRRTWWFVAAGACAAVALLLGAIAIDGAAPSRTQRPPVQLAAVVPPPVLAAPLAPPPVADVAHAADPAPSLLSGPAQPRITARPAKKGRSIVALPPTTTQVAAPTPTAAEVAQHYGAIGRALKRLDASHGLDATLDLWPRYRRIRINAVLANGDQRREVTSVLHRLEQDIKAGARPRPTN